MVKINPFCGITYNFDKLSLSTNLFAPPYDVISSAYQEELYKRDKYNIVRLILAKVDGEKDADDRYTKAAKDYKQWLEEGIMVKSDYPRLYYYIQKYQDMKGVKVERKGFISRCYLEEFDKGVILPHEETMGGPKKDRLNLMLATKANFSQIFAIYSDPERLIDGVLKEACNNNPLIDVVDDDDVQHIFYEITDINVIDRVKSLMSDKTAIIADGHHRYETALNYRNIRRAEEGNDTSEDKPYNSTMFYFANLDDEGLRIYPTHRLLKKGIDFSLDRLVEKLKPYFSLNKFKISSIEDIFTLVEEENEAGLTIGFLCKQDISSLYILRPDMSRITEALEGQNVPKSLLGMDVTILHRFVFEKLMTLDTKELKKHSNIEFIRKESELIDKFNKDDAECIFLMNAPSLQKVKDVCMAGHRMPQKSTYFYPKLLSGLVINSLE